MRRTLYAYLFICLSIAGLSTRSTAQTISTGTVSPVSVCAGGAVSIAYTVSASFAAGNTFSAQLSDATGIFPIKPVAIGTLTSVTSGTINATIPSSTAAGTGYRVRVIASTPSQTGSTSLSSLTVNVPVSPGITTPITYCVNQVASPLAATPSAGGTLKWYAVDGTSTSATAPTPDTKSAGPTSYSVSQVVGGCESARSVITVNVSVGPNAPGVSSVSYCIGQSATSLTATPLPSATLTWYTSASAGTGSSIAPTPSTKTAGTTVYYVSQTIGSCESLRASLTVTVNSAPAAPTATAPPPYCAGAVATSLTATGQNLKWYGTAAVGGTGSSVATVPNTTSAGTINYYVSQTVGTCESARTGIAVVINPAPSVPTTTTLTYCQNQAAVALVATPSDGGKLNWYGTAATGGIASTTATIPTTSSAGMVNYYVSQTVSGCEGPRAAIGVTTKATPFAPGITTPITACQNRTGYALVATPSAGGTLNWYGTSATGGTATPNPGPPATTTVGSTLYYVSQTLSGCEGPRASITVAVNAVPVPPSVIPPRTYCQTETASPLVANGIALKWYGTDSTNRNPATEITVPSTSSSFIGSINYYVTQTVNGCESYVRAIPVTIKVTPSLPAVQDVSFCQNYPAVPLTATPVPNATLNWYGENASGGTASAAPPTIPTNVDKTYTYYVSQTLDGCESGLGSTAGRAIIRARVKTTPGAPGVSPVSFCNNSTAQALTANGTGLKWYDGADNLLGVTPVPGTGTVGNQVYKVTQTSGEGCESPKASLTVIINPLPGQPGVSNLTYCQTQQDQPPQNVIPLTASGQNLRWYNPDGNAYPNAPIPSLDRAGTQSYQVSQTVNNCEGAKATIQVNVNTLPAPITPKAVVTYCVNAKAVPLQANGETGSQLKWIDPYGRITTDAPTPSTLNTNVVPGGDPFYVYQIGTNGCYSPRATIKAVVTSPPTLALFAPVASTNLGQKVPLRLTFTSSGPFTYTITGGYSGSSITADTTISVLPRGNTIYQVETVTNGCGVGLPGSPATAQVSVRVPTIETSILTTSTLCVGRSLSVPFTTTGTFNTGNTFNVELVSLVDTTKKYDLPATAMSSPVTATLPTTLPGGNYFVRVKANNPEIGIVGSNSPTPLAIRALASAVLTGSQTIYEAMPVNLTMTLGGDGPWAIVYSDSLRSYSATVGSNPYVLEARPTQTTTYRLTSVSNACGSGPVSGVATITVIPLLGVIDNPLDPLVRTYPVPTATTLMVELDLPLTRQPATLLLTDASGRPILQRTTRDRVNELDLTTQPNGLYLLRIQVGDRQTVRKVIKQ
jgi:hypothetical protein